MAKSLAALLAEAMMVARNRGLSDIEVETLAEEYAEGWRKAAHKVAEEYGRIQGWTDDHKLCAVDAVNAAILGARPSPHACWCACNGVWLAHGAAVKVSADGVRHVFDGVCEVAP